MAALTERHRDTDVDQCENVGLPVEEGALDVAPVKVSAGADILLETVDDKLLLFRREELGVFGEVFNEPRRDQSNHDRHQTLDLYGDDRER